MRRALACVVALVATASVEAGPITAISASGTGTFNNSTNLLIDGVFPPRNTTWNFSPNVWWNGTAPAFTIDYGSVYSITSLTVDVDNNDTYRVQYSTDGVNFTDLFDFLASDGPVPVNPGGMDILTTDPTFPTNPGDLTTPAYVGRTFLPVNARYLKIFAVSGDNSYSIGEVQAFSNATVPEPISLVVFGGLIVGGAGVALRRRMKKEVA
jgi:hypothetical protein